MNRHRVFIIGLAAIVAGGLVSPLAVEAQDDQSDGIDNQLRIMTRVLEASIGKDSLDRRLNVSVFDSKIRAKYIPTVGAIFTIPISFPLHPSQSEKGDTSEEVVDVDLWEHFSNANENASSAAAPTPSSEEQFLTTVRKYADELGDEPSDEQRLKKIMSRMGEIPLIGVAKRGVFDLDLSIGDGKPYDPVKVSTLTRSIIQTIAHYGHRLKSLQNSERVLVILEAPGPQGSAKPVEVSTEYKGADEDLQSSGWKNDVGRWSEAVLEREKRIRSGRLNAFNRRPSDSGTAGFFVRTKQLYDFPSEWLYDRRLLAFKKSDLQQERSYDSIKGKVETTDY